uniref:Putative secreted protein n=1 Tax=Amblyomma cajennense TaxID=34607 RepID=A0A023FDL8_AMBCJ
MFLYFLALTLIVAALGERQCEHFYIDDYTDCENSELRSGYFYNRYYQDCFPYDYCRNQGAESKRFNNMEECKKTCNVPLKQKDVPIEDQ